jgi:ABC-type lipoprotein export system ATPase subunit
VGNQENILKLIRESCERENVSLLLVTHSTDVAGQFQRVERLSDFNRTKATA